MYISTGKYEVREIYLPAVAFQLLVKAASENIQWTASQTQEPEPEHLKGKRTLTLYGVRYIEEVVAPSMFDKYTGRPNMVYPVGAR